LGILAAIFGEASHADYSASKVSPEKKERKKKED
jgi:hypothetical protein